VEQEKNTACGRCARATRPDRRGGRERATRRIPAQPPDERAVASSMPKAWNIPWNIWRMNLRLFNGLRRKKRRARRAPEGYIGRIDAKGNT